MKKIFLICMLVLLCVGTSCRYFRPSGNTGCNYNYCCVNGPANTPFVATYPDGHKYRGTIGGNGVGTFALPNGFPCSSVAVLVGSNFGFALSADPSTADLTAPPSTVTINGQYMDATYAMPLVEYFDSYGYLIGSVAATSVAGDGTSLVAPTPDLSSVYSGTYQIKVTNMTSDGEYLNTIGTATLTGWGRNPTDSDGDGLYDYEDCYPYNASLWSCDLGGGGGGEGGGDCITSICPIEGPVY